MRGLVLVYVGLGGGCLQPTPGFIEGDGGTSSGGTPTATLDPTDAGSEGSCGAPLLQCGPLCIDPSTDEDHCGGCDGTCAPGEACIDGGCEVACPQGTLVCGIECVDVGTNEDHCGDCSSPCDSAAVCEAETAGWG